MPEEAEADDLDLSFLPFAGSPSLDFEPSPLDFEPAEPPADLDDLDDLDAELEPEDFPDDEERDEEEEEEEEEREALRFLFEREDFSLRFR